MTIVEFLLARIAEDERGEVIEYPIRDGHLKPVHVRLKRETPTDRWLAECKAKRRIVEAFEDERTRRDIYNRGYNDGLLTTNDDLRNRLASNAECRGLEIAMEAHAAIYADHPDYDSAWLTT